MKRFICAVMVITSLFTVVSPAGGSSDTAPWTAARKLAASLVGDGLVPDLPIGQMAGALTAFLTLLKDGEAAEPTEETPPDTADVRSGPQTSVSVQKHGDIEKKIEAVAEKYGAVGLQAAVIEGGRVTDTYAWGWATKKTDKMTDGHKIRVASITKIAVAMCLTVLWEKGVLTPETELGDCWGLTIRNPRYESTPVTLDSILSHTSSISTAVSSTASGVKNSLARGKSFINAKPGTLSAFRYNNNAIEVLGMTLEHVTGTYLDDILEPILTALDMDASFWSGEIEGTDLLATLYQHGGSVGRSAAKARSVKKPSKPGSAGNRFSGGFTVSAGDLAKLIALLAGDGVYDGVRLLSEESVEYIESPAGEISGGFTQCHPLRYKPDIFGRENIYYHTGSAYGAYNLICYDPDTGDGVVVLTTGASSGKSSDGIYGVCADIAEYILKTIK